MLLLRKNEPYGIILNDNGKIKTFISEQLTPEILNEFLQKVQKEKRLVIFQWFLDNIEIVKFKKNSYVNITSTIEGVPYSFQYFINNDYLLTVLKELIQNIEKEQKGLELYVNTFTKYSDHILILPNTPNNYNFINILINSMYDPNGKIVTVFLQKDNGKLLHLFTLPINTKMKIGNIVRETNDLSATNYTLNTFEDLLRTFGGDRK